MRLIATVFFLINSLLIGSNSPTSPKSTSSICSDKKGSSYRPLTSSHLLSVTASIKDLELGDGAYEAKVALLTKAFKVLMQEQAVKPVSREILLAAASKAGLLLESHSPTKEVTHSPLYPLMDLPLNPPGAGSLANTKTMLEP